MLRASLRIQGLRAHLIRAADRSYRHLTPGRQGVCLHNAHALRALLWNARPILTGCGRGGVPRRQGLHINNADGASGALNRLLSRRQGVPGGQGVRLYDAHAMLYDAHAMLAAVRRL